MSIYFIDETNQDVWNPSNMVGRILCSQLESVAKVLDVECGLGPIVSDEVRIDRPKFRDFAQLFAKQVLDVQNPAFGALLSGALAIVLALLERMGMTVPLHDTSLRSALETGRGLIGESIG